MATVTVIVDTSVSPPAITLDPVVLPITGKKETIHWVPMPGVTPNFKFAALAFDHKNPFSNIVVTDSKITADDDNQRKEDHSYSVFVNVRGTYFSSGPHVMISGPTIRNK